MSTRMSDLEWQRIRVLLPPQKPRTGRPAHDHRMIVDGILWVKRTGGRWRQMPAEFGPWSTVASRYHRWNKTGVWARIDAALGALAIESQVRAVVVSPIRSDECNKDEQLAHAGAVRTLYPA